MQKPKRSIARSVARVAVGLVVGCAIAEGAFHLRDGGAFPHVNFYVPDDALGVRLRAGATEKISFGGNPVTSVRINAEGYRGEDWGAPAGDETIVFGDSQVFGLGVEETQTFSAVAATAGKGRVLNAGVPTYGPVEMEKELSRLVAARKPKTVVYAVNFVNDPFEAERPNTERHRVWDGWAVRTETAPAEVTSFPGRELLFGKSHAVFALRQWMHSFSAAPAARLPSEGAAQDLLDLDAALATEKARAADETLARWERDEAARRAATLEAINADQRVKQVAFKQQKLQGESAGVYLVAGASPGDIVIPQLGEEGSPLAATAEFVNQAAALRTKIEAKMVEDAKARPDDPLSKDAIDALAHRDASEQRARALLASPVEILRATQPIVRRALAAKKIAEEGGARFVLLVLPMDVQVSDEEWKKYGAEKRDMKPTRVLIDDLVGAVRDAGATAIDPTDALAAAEPGAFLDKDPHMTPKGHEIVGRALAQELAKPLAKPPPRPSEAAATTKASLALPEGRSRVPSPSEWDRVGELQVHGSDALRCRTQRIREWMLVRCRKSAEASAPHEIRILRSGNDEAMTFVSSEMSTLLAPVVRGQKFLAHFSWPGRASDLNSDWMATAAETDRSFVKAEEPADPPRADDHAALSACLASEKRDVAGFIGGANTDCERTWAKDCKRMVACAEGSPMSAPVCLPGQVNAGAALWCKKTDATLGTAPPAATPASIAPGDAPFEKDAFQKAATAFLDAARGYGETCHLTCEEPGNWFNFICYDTCDTTEAKVKPALDAFEALAPFEKTRAPRLALVFLGHAHALRDFLAGVPKAHVARGTLALFQDTAVAYDAFDPGAKVALVPKVPLDEFFVKHPVPGVSYIWEQPRCVDDAWNVVDCVGKTRRVTGYELRAHRGTPLVWRMGAQGLFLTD